MELIIGIFSVISFILGVVLTLAKKSLKTGFGGKLFIDQSNPDKDVYRLEVDIPFEEIANNKTLLLKIVKNR